MILSFMILCAVHPALPGCDECGPLSDSSTSPHGLTDRRKFLNKSLFNFWVFWFKSWRSEEIPNIQGRQETTAPKSV
ncbi:MAG: hypothetical protein K1X78_07175 [Verrucomicrobiaceae bacterium]|nr:hypothetical protein [Verrucomicrobiaceae bacterium]